MSTGTARGRRVPRGKDPDALTPPPPEWKGRDVALLVARPGDTYGQGFFVDDLAKRIASYEAIGRAFTHVRAVDQDGRPATIPHPAHPQVACQLWVPVTASGAR